MKEAEEQHVTQLRAQRGLNEVQRHGLQQGSGTDTGAAVRDEAGETSRS